MTLEERLAFYEDSIRIEFEKIHFIYGNGHQQIKEENNKKLSRYGNGTFQRTKKKRPIAFISSPLI